MSAQKECFKCHGCFPLSEFYAHPMMADGHLNKCKACTKRDVWLRTEEKKADPQWMAKERARCAKKQREAAALLQGTIKQRARVAVRNAVRDGRMTRPTDCAACGTLCRPDAHHTDYTKPLEVQWLCRICHTKAHGRYRSDLRGEAA